MKKSLLTLFILILAMGIQAQDLEYPLSYNPFYDDVISGEQTTISIDIVNSTEFNTTIESIKILKFSDEISHLTTTPILLSANEGITITFSANLKHNIHYDIPVLFELSSAVGNYSHLSYIDFDARYDDEYYDTTFDLYGNQLFSELSDLLSGHSSFTYKEARKIMYGELDNFDGWIETVYIGRMLETSDIPNVNTTHVNTEHTWPQSLGAKNEPQLSDMFHIYPSDENANSTRGSSPFGNVAEGIIWEEAGSKLGQNTSGYLVFEPRDVHKGNVARSMFYFATRYGNMNNFLTSQESDLREWMNVDTVDEKEIRRNELIFKYQKNRNPYIDHPEFLDRINSISGGHDFPAKREFITSKLSSVYHLSDDSLRGKFRIVNTGNTTISVTDIISNASDSWLKISREEVHETIKPKEGTNVFYKIDRQALESEKLPASSEVKIVLGDTTIAFSLSADLIHTSVADGANREYYLSQNYPNPASEFTTIEFSLPTVKAKDVALIFTDVLGREVYDASNDLQISGDGRGLLHIDTSSLNRHGSVLYYTLRCGDYSATRILLLN